MRDTGAIKYIVLGAILVVYLDWGRLFGDIQRIITIMTAEVQTHEQSTDQ